MEIVLFSILALLAIALFYAITIGKKLSNSIDELKHSMEEKFYDAKEEEPNYLELFHSLMPINKYCTQSSPYQVFVPILYYNAHGGNWYIDWAHNGEIVTRFFSKKVEDVINTACDWYHSKFSNNC